MSYSQIDEIMLCWRHKDEQNGMKNRFFENLGTPRARQGRGRSSLFYPLKKNVSRKVFAVAVVEPRGGR